MGRPRQFDRHEALTKALHVFWTRGYEATSMTDIQRALGIGRQSLYSTFGDKDALFEEVLQLYVTLSEQTIASRFDAACGIETIRLHLCDVITRMTQPDPRPGCLITNTCIERGSNAGHCSELVFGSFELMTTCFTRALQNASDAGLLAANLSVPAAAYSLTLLNTGILVQVRNGAKAGELRAAVDSALDAMLATR